MILQKESKIFSPRPVLGFGVYHDERELTEKENKLFFMIC